MFFFESEFCAAFRTELIIRFSLKATAAASPFPRIAVCVRYDTFRKYRHFTAFNLSAQFVVDLHHCITAGRAHTITSSPLEYGNEKQTQIGIDHIYFQVSVPAAAAANNQLVKLKFLSSLADAHDEKHRLSPSCRLIEIKCGCKFMAAAFCSILKL